MESKIRLHCDLEGKPNIVIDYNFNNGEDVRDKLVGIFVNDLWPSGRNEQSEPVMLTMYCDKQTDGGMVAIIYKDEKNEKAAASSGVIAFKAVADKWLQQNLPHDLYKKWVDEVLYLNPKDSENQAGQSSKTKSPWINAFDAPPPYEFAGVCRTGKPGNYIYHSMVRERDRVFIGEQDFVLYLRDKQLQDYEWLDESDFEAKRKESLLPAIGNILKPEQ